MNNNSSKMEMGMNIGGNIEIIGDNYNKEKGTILDMNNEAAKIFLSSREEEKQKEEQLYKQKEDAKDIAIHWYTSYIYKNEIKPWWMSIDIFGNNNDNDTRDLVIFDDQLPKNAVTTQQNLWQKQMFHIKQQEMIKAKSKENENENENNNVNDIDNDPLRRKQIDINRLGVVN
eukprot:81271_1